MNNKKSFSNIINPCWTDIFDSIDKDIYKITEDSYNELLQNQINIFPTCVNIFNFINYCIPGDIKVIILGQDPYHGVYKDKQNIYKSQATGLAFSVPKECPIPPSLKNIYENQLKFKIMILEKKILRKKYFTP